MESSTSGLPSTLIRDLHFAFVTAPCCDHERPAKQEQAEDGHADAGPKPSGFVPQFEAGRRAWDVNPGEAGRLKFHGSIGRRFNSPSGIERVGSNQIRVGPR